LKGWRVKDLSDSELLAACAGSSRDEAFGEIVRRHVDAVYSSALRSLGDSHAAEEAVQAAFLALAKRIGGLPPGTVIAGWLHRAVQFAARNLRRAEARRRHWEDQAAMMEGPDGEERAYQDQVWPQVDEALTRLGNADRDALILRFLHQKSLKEVAFAIGTSEDAAKKRVQRAIERLRGFLIQQGVTVPLAVLGLLMTKLPATAAPAEIGVQLASAAGRAALPQALIPLAEGGVPAAIWGPAKILVSVLAGLMLVVGILSQSRTRDSGATSPLAMTTDPSTSLRIQLSATLVDDQAKALQFYSEVLGLVRKRDFPIGTHRWLTVGSAVEGGRAEMLLEPTALPAAQTFQQGLFRQGIPINSLGTSDVRKEFERLKGLGVVFTQEPFDAGATTLAVFRDTCGNLMQLHQRPNPPGREGTELTVDINSIMVSNQDKAVRFYTEILGFKLKRDIPVAGEFRWITLVSETHPDGMELSLEPNANPLGKTYQEALFQQGIPYTSFAVSDVQKTYETLARKGVVFSMKPTPLGMTVLATFEDTCGNRIQLVQE